MRYSYFCHCERGNATRGNLISPPFASGNTHLSPSLAEGVRGWVLYLVIARIALAIRGNLNGIASDLQNKQLAIQWDCHDLPLASLAMTDKGFPRESRYRLDSYPMTKKAFSCHTEGFLSPKYLKCNPNTEIFPQYDNVSVNRDISPRATHSAQYDKHSLIASNSQ